MAKPWVIIVSGSPAAGKTTLARRLARDLKLPLVTKDDIKESLFETLGWNDREWSKKVGYASFILLFEFLERQVEAGKSAIAENAFYPEFDRPRFQRLSSRYKLETFEVHLTADHQVLIDRFENRSGSPERHPGHSALGEHESLESKLTEGVFGPLELGGELLIVDTSDFSTVDWDSVVARVKNAMGG